MSALKTYGAENFMMLEDYNFKFNSIEQGQPDVTVELSGGMPTVIMSQWWRTQQDERVRFKYIGMDYDTAQRCANAMRNMLTFPNEPWLFGEYLSNINNVPTMLYGWHKGIATPTLESEVRLEHRGGCMYDVVVNAHCATENYTNEGITPSTNTRPLAETLRNIPGYFSVVQLSGKHFDAAQAKNMSLIVAPTRTTQFELAAENIAVTDPSSLSGFTIDNWYKATTDWQAQVKYEGMTNVACKQLQAALNSKSGWWLSSHPWEYKCENKIFGWYENTDITMWQSLNEYKCSEDSSGMCTAELTLHAQIVQMTKNPTNYQPPTYPSFWSSNIPGLSSYL